MYSVYAELAASRGMKNYAVAKATGIGQDTLSRWKNGKGEPSVETLQTLADFFGVSMDHLCGREAQKKAAPRPQPEDGLSIEERAAQILSGLSDNADGTLMLDGAPASAEAVEAFRAAVEQSVETARRINRLRKKE